MPNVKDTLKKVGKAKTKVIKWKIYLYVGLALLLISLPIILIVTFILLFGGGDSDSTQGYSVNGKCSVGGGSVSGKGVDTFEKSAKGGALEGKGDYMVKSAKKHKIDPKIFMAIVAHETGYGKSPMVKENNNPAGLMGSGEPFEFDSIDEGIDAAAKNLYDLYFSKGLTTVEKIQPKYAPIGADNDPEDSNSNWKTSIKGIMKTIDGEDSKNKGCSANNSKSDGKGFDFKGKFPKPDKSKYNGQSYPWGQCTWYVHQRRKEIGKPVPLTWGNGGDWGDNAKSQGWKVGSEPKAGAGASIKPGSFGAPSPYGHIMFVEKVKDDGGIVVSEANVKGEGVISSREFSKDDTKQMQFIYDK